MWTVLVNLTAKVWDPINELAFKALWTCLISRTPKHFHRYLIADFLQLDLLPAFVTKVVVWVLRLKVVLFKVLHQVEHNFDWDFLSTTPIVNWVKQVDFVQLLASLRGLAKD